MRLAFCCLSNNIQNFLQMTKSFHYDLHDVSYSNVDSFTRNVLFNPPIPYLFHKDGWNCEYKTYNFRSAIDMFTMRQDSFKMAKNADLIFIMDDDFEFKKGSTAVINQSCLHMTENPDCGAIYHGGNFGGEGALHGDEIYITNKGHLGTNRGIIVRNRKEDLLDNRLHALGANFDAVIGFTCLLQGYYVARRLHVPIEHHTKNVMRENHPNKFYSLDYLRNYGIMSKVNKVIGRWNDHAVWPDNIFVHYRQGAMRNSRMLWYTVEGDIIQR
jgi:hypothetical protein